MTFKKIVLHTLFLVAATSAKAQTKIKAPDDVQSLLSKHNCVSCHKAEKKGVGPAWVEISKLQYSKKRFVALVYAPEPSNWKGYAAMVGLPKVPKADLEKIHTWVNSLNP